MLIDVGQVVLTFACWTLIVLVAALLAVVIVGVFGDPLGPRERRVSEWQRSGVLEHREDRR